MKNNFIEYITEVSDESKDILKGLKASMDKIKKFNKDPHKMIKKELEESYKGSKMKVLKTHKGSQSVTMENSYVKFRALCDLMWGDEPMAKAIISGRLDITDGTWMKFDFS